MNSLSSFDSTSLACVATPLSVHCAGKAYSMMESGSNSVPLIWSIEYLKNTLCRVVAASQKLGGPARALSTTGSFH